MQINNILLKIWLFSNWSHLLIISPYEENAYLFDINNFVYITIYWVCTYSLNWSSVRMQAVCSKSKITRISLPWKWIYCRHSNMNFCLILPIKLYIRLSMQLLKKKRKWRRLTYEILPPLHASQKTGLVIDNNFS